MTPLSLHWTEDKARRQLDRAAGRRKGGPQPDGADGGMCLASRMLAATSSVRKRHVHSEAPIRMNANLRRERHGTRRQIISAGIMPLLTELEKRSKPVL